MSNELVKPGDMPSVRPGVKLTGLAARKAAANALSAEKRELTPNDMPHRIGIVFDDSGSMGIEQSRDAKEGCEEFLRSCTKDQTAVAVYPMTDPALPLCMNLPAVAIMVKQIYGGGVTPLVQTLAKMLKHNSLTRAIVFSDGAPNGFQPELYEQVLSYKIPIDTIYIPDSYSDPRAEAFMQKLAENSSGIYLKFERGKSNFATAFKYLSPGLRYMLADKSFVASLEGR